MVIKRNQQPVWVHTERDAPRTPRIHQRAQRGLRNTVSPTNDLQVLWARKPIQTDLGRCLAIRLLPLPVGPTLQVLVAAPNRTTAWFDAEKALTQRQAEAWARMGF